MERFKIRIDYKPLNVWAFPHVVVIQCAAGTTLDMAIALAKSYESDIRTNKRRGYILERVSVISETIPDGE